MAEHTRGPWMREGYIIIGDDGSQVAYLPASSNPDEVEANAQLIKAAPETDATLAQLQLAIRDLAIDYGPHPVAEALMSLLTDPPKEDR